MAQIEIIYFSGYGHTTKQAEAVLEGAQSVGNARLWALPEDGVASEAMWDAADEADALIFGSPTYMGNAAWQFKRFADESSKRWFGRSWSNKVAGGFTNSASTVGDKGVTMAWLQTLAAQHGMHWIALDQMPANAMVATTADRNWAGGSAGALSTSPSDASPEEGPSEGDLISAKDYGARVALWAAKFAGE
ncbi:MAG: flavodoxin family protein [Shimia sp.]|uniref:flavodoxin family protein n=1 Tax=Shimia sp. TaxID=1954381 RepID=UPI004057CEA6